MYKHYYVAMYLIHVPHINHVYKICFEHRNVRPKRNQRNLDSKNPPNPKTPGIGTLRTPFPDRNLPQVKCSAPVDPVDLKHPPDFVQQKKPIGITWIYPTPRIPVANEGL